MAGVLRGQVRWATLNPVRGHEQGGTRPVVILSHDVFNDRSGTAIAMAVTSHPQKAAYPLTMEFASSARPKRSWVKISQIRTLSVDRIGDVIETLSPEQLNRLVEGLGEIVG